MAYRRRDDFLSDVLTNEQVEQLIAMKNSGMKVKDIAEHFHIHRNTVTNIVDRYRRAKSGN